jgi:ABC-2 type transport system ATP-binding protein
MLQTGSLIGHLRVRELVAMVASLYPRPLEVENVLALSGCGKFADRPTTKLSGGQVQRVRFAIALVANPDFLLLDEPTAALDVEGRRDFWASMRTVAAGGKTILFATHHLEEADAYADRIVVLARGCIIADGPPAEIKARSGGRTIRATLPDADPATLRALAEVIDVELRGDTVTFTSSNAEATLRELLNGFSSVRDLEVRGAGLEEAFIALTSDTMDDRDERLESR